MAATRGSPRTRIHPANPNAAGRLAADLGVSPLLAQLLINRGLADPDQARSFLDAPEGRLSSPFDLPQMDRLVELVLSAVGARHKIVVYGDYDADGVTATSLLVRVLRSLGASVDYYIPQRRSEGYGLHASAVRRLAEAGAQLIVAVDCGITAGPAAVVAREAGVGLAILDHHLPLGELPPASAIVNPKLGSKSATDYCAAGLALQAARALLGTTGAGALPPDVIGVAALGTVADAVTLRGDNRIIVASGLRALGAPSWPGLRALLEVAKAQMPLQARTLSHGLAPRLNAAGRLADAAIGVRLLVSDDDNECREIAATLDQLNRERRVLCDAVLAEAVEEVERLGLAQEPALVLAREGWHPGVVGIVASQLVDRYYRPAVVIGISDGIGKGSARSIPPVHLVGALTEASGLLAGYGGHAMAAGLTLTADAVDAFRRQFVAAVGAGLGADDLIPVLEVDAELTLDAITPALSTEIDRLAPFGNGNPPPRFLARGLRAVGTRLVGGGEHLRLVVADGDQTREAIAFRQGEAVEWLAFTQARVDVAFGVELHVWGAERTIQLVIEHLWTPDVDLSAVTADVAGVLARLFARAEDYLDTDHAGIDDAPAFHTKVVGVTFEGRQAILPLVRSGDHLALVRDPANPVDPHAVKVCTLDMRQLGFLRADLAARLAPSMDAGARYAATAASLTGGGDRAWGLNILIERETASVFTNGDGHSVGLPAAADLRRVARARLLRGRALARHPEMATDAILNGRPTAIRVGPGRGLVVASFMGAMASLSKGGGPVAIVLPRAAEVDAWAAASAPWFRVFGVRAWGIHGASPARARRRLAVALDRGAVDVLIASTSWILDRSPRVSAVIQIADASTVNDVMSVRAASSRVPSLVLGPVPEPELAAHADAWGIADVIDAAEPRTNVRVVDHRGRGPWTLPEHPGGRFDPAVLVANDARHAVDEARALRDSNPGRAAEIAYYHDGLPASLQRVLADLLAAGKITVLTAGSLLVDPSLPPGVARVVAAGIPPTRILAAEAYGASGVHGGVGLVELRYGSDAVARAQSSVAERFPNRETLVRAFQYLRAVHGRGAWTWPLDPAQYTAAGIPQEVLAAALEVFVEAGVVVGEGEGSAIRYSLAETTERIDLDRSLRHREGARAHAAWREVAAWAAAPIAALLADLAGP